LIPCLNNKKKSPNTILYMGILYTDTNFIRSMVLNTPRAFTGGKIGIIGVALLRMAGKHKDIQSHYYIIGSIVKNREISKRPQYVSR